MNFLFFQILRIENGVVARDAEDDLAELVAGCLIAASMPGKRNGDIYREIGPRKDIGRRVPVDGSFVDDK